MLTAKLCVCTNMKENCFKRINELCCARSTGFLPICIPFYLLFPLFPAFCQTKLPSSADCSETAKDRMSLSVLDYCIQSKLHFDMQNVHIFLLVRCLEVHVSQRSYFLCTFCCTVFEKLACIDIVLMGICEHATYQNKAQTVCYYLKKKVTFYLQPFPSNQQMKMA